MDYPSLYQFLDKTGLQVPAIGTGQAWGEERLSLIDPDRDIREAAVQRVISHFPSAAKMNALVIIGLVRGIVQPGVSNNQAWEWLIINLQRIVEEAGKSGVRLCLEPINRGETNFINTVEEGISLIEKVGCSNLGLLLDTYHLTAEGIDIPTAINLARDHLFHFHVADDNRWYPGGGHLDFERILKNLSVVGYDGFISGEFLPMPDADTAADLGLQRLREICLEQ
jgi:sugar phosphate isomerase/epimerase